MEAFGFNLLRNKHRRQNKDFLDDSRKIQITLHYTIELRSFSEGWTLANKPLTPSDLFFKMLFEKVKVNANLLRSFCSFIVFLFYSRSC